jgi:hypothetical protein
MESTNGTTVSQQLDHKGVRRVPKAKANTVNRAANFWAFHQVQRSLYTQLREALARAPTSDAAPWTLLL